ncbi:hypothetical protein FRUB_05526 [Fimbriiglobus ruber]|uniref:DUF5076 domain-containing protein n=1 Tax=Fimbriiglobus ruber TaxID=1908690 RepID=A0A225DWR7_9BACT|nr:hypothetical protein FRUB_05526 [Fimbriiglobus ruber]
MFDDPDVWGILLADAAQHLAHATEELTGVDAAETLKKIAAAFDREMEAPSDEHTGEFKE